MIRSLVIGERGYSLVEVMVSIMILAIAIIPMVSMFDAGLRSASSSGNYDKARSLANQRLENAKSLPYDTVRDNFPTGTGAPGTSGTVTSNPIPVSQLPNGNYRIIKTYISRELADDSDNSDRGLMKVTVIVNWGASNSYSTSGVVVR